MVGLNRAGSCPACGGAWVPFESCEAVLPRLEELASDVEPAAEAPVGGAFKCPGCGGDMVRVKTQGAAVSAMHTCLVCFGRWVDGNEMARTRARGLGGLFRRLLRGLVPKGRPARSGPPPAPPSRPAGPPETGGSEESARMEPPDNESSESTESPGKGNG
jgi:Zn-finger nucleic acid-binding protein